MERTLLLNQGFEPVATISWQRAVCLLTRNKVEVIEEYDHHVHSVYLVIKMPAVVRLITKFRRPRHRVKFSRQNVLARDRWKCQYCGRKRPIAELTFDHVVPRAQGGRTSWENIVTACQGCNARKGNRTPEQSGMRLRSTPVRPNWVPVFQITLSRQAAPKEWVSYLYWNSELLP